MLAFKRLAGEVNTELRTVHRILPVGLRGDLRGGLQSDVGVPLTGGQHRHLVQELVNARHQVATVTSLVGNLMKNLGEEICTSFHVLSNPTTKCYTFGP